jgi:hypothetical protein
MSHEDVRGTRPDEHGALEIPAFGCGVRDGAMPLVVQSRSKADELVDEQHTPIIATVVARPPTPIGAPSVV